METIPMDLVCIEWRKVDEDTIRRLYFATNLTTAKMEPVKKAVAMRRIAQGAGVMYLGTETAPTNPPED